MKTNKPIDVLTIGDVCIDLYMKVEGDEVSEDTSGALPKICFYHGSKIPVTTLKTNIGGNAINVAVGLKELGIHTAIYSEMGDDEYAQKIEKELKNLDIETKFLVKDKDTMTGMHPIIVYDGERTIFSHHEKRNYKLQDWPDLKWIYYTSVSPGFEKFQADLCDYLNKNRHIGVAFNPGTFHLKKGLAGIKDFLKVTHVLYLNMDEAINLFGNHALPELHKKIQEFGPKLTFITLGKNGSSAYDGRELVQIGPYVINKPVADKTGAGDAFSSGSLAALNYSKPLYDTVLWGAINSSNVIRTVGAINGLQTKEKMEQQVKEEKSKNETGIYNKL